MTPFQIRLVIFISLLVSNSLRADERQLAAQTNQGKVDFSHLLESKQKRQVDSQSQVAQSVTTVNTGVLPSIWQTWRLYLPYLLMALLVALFVHAVGLRRVKRQKAQTEVVIAQRTAELTARHKHLAQLLQQKCHLLANLSHELRTPLTLIVGPMQRLLENCQDEQLSKQYDLINRNALRLLNLVEQLLELERFENSHNSPQKKYALAESLRLLVESFIPLAESMGQRIQLHIETDGVIHLIQDSLEKILSNLLVNAIKYSPAGSDIDVVARRKDEQLILMVTDQGKGITTQQLPSIFQRFVRVEGNEHIAGSGVGLAVVKELVSANKGSIKVEREPKLGSCFTVVLPMPLEPDIADNVSQASQIPSLAQQDDLCKMADKEACKASMLIIEGDTDMRQFLSDLFVDDFDCIVASNGTEGLEKTHRYLPDAIISDVMMAGINGFELASILRNSDITAHIPIILLTGKGDEQSRYNGFEQGVDDYIVKPVNPTELKLRVRRCLHIRRLLRKRYAGDVLQSLQTQSNVPEAPKFNNLREEKFYQKFVAAIEQNYQDPSFSRSKAATLLALSERQLNRKLGAMVDYNFNQYLRKYRLNQAQQLLACGGQITQVSYDVGYGSPSYFSNCFKAEYGISPSEYVASTRTQ